MHEIKSSPLLDRSYVGYTDDIAKAAKLVDVFKNVIQIEAPAMKIICLLEQIFTVPELWPTAPSANLLVSGGGTANC
jgi:hypothetical protein